MEKSSGQMKVLLADDELLALDELEFVVSRAEQRAVIYKADNYADVLKICEKEKPDIVFLDIEMPGMDGLTLTRKLKETEPEINIIMVTAYSSYALDALKLYVSDYILKPAKEEDIRKALAHLRNPIIGDVGDKATGNSKIWVQCFGNFEVFHEGQPLRFSRNKTKELFAYLIDLRGSSAEILQICEALWGIEGVEEKKHNYLRQLILDLRTTLRSIDSEEVLIARRNRLAIDVSRVECDYYQYLKKERIAVNSYKGDYMKQYDWAYMSLDDI